jgi:hypothetical protein
MPWTGAERRLVLLAVAAAAALLPPSPARADAASVALAEQLYDDAKAAMAREEYATACQKFAESHRLDPATGGTLLNLAVCHEKMGKPATAKAEFAQAAQLAQHFQRPDRVQVAKDHIERLQPLASSITLDVAEGTATMAGLRVAIDGTAIGRAAWDNIPVDPGEHTVTAEAPGKIAYSRHLTIGEAQETPVVDVPILPDAPAPAPTASALSPTMLVPPASSDAELARAASAHRAVAFLLGGVGAAGIAVGAAFGLEAIHQNHLSEQRCGTPSSYCPTDPNGSQALAYADVSDVAFGVALVALGVGTYFLVTAPKVPPPSRVAGGGSVAVTPSLTSRGGSLGISATW